MGSSMRKKKEKQKDFQKTKFKVGKDKVKPSNFTDTSFKSKEPLVNPVGTYGILTKLLPLISDSSTPVRNQLLKLFRALPKSEVRHSTEQAVMFIRAGMTHLSADISNDTLGVMEWLLDVAEDDLVTCPGGWVKTLNSFCALMGWALSSLKSGWSSGSRAGLRAKDASTYARQITTLARFLEAGLRSEIAIPDDDSEKWDNLYRIPRDSNAFEYLNLYGSRRDEEGEMYPNREARQRVFERRFLEGVLKGADQAKKEGGATGRAAAILDKVLQEGMGDYESATAMETEDLLSLW
ncbi:rRNA processing protein [Neonectria punicea]|uniref:Pre-rRNA-processing protein n=1 Tax=Neonectria punicea TaxID=979145 RepID=A0ABR1GKQ9_9HYPO